MKKLFGILLMSFITALAAHAQGDSTAPVIKRLNLKDELGLTKEVDKQIKAIKADYRVKEEALLRDTSIMDSTKGPKKDALKVDRENKIIALLTPQQKTKYEQYKEKLKLEKEAQDPHN